MGLRLLSLLLVAVEALPAQFKDFPAPQVNVILAEECSFCPCNKAYYLEPQDCAGACSSANCTQACTPITLDQSYGKETESAAPGFREWFPKLSCFGILSSYLDENDFAFAVGLKEVVIFDEDIDYVFGNKDGVLALSEFEKFLAHYGFKKKVSCAAPVGTATRIAVFGTSANGVTTVDHAARSVGPSFGDGQWWESKIGTGDVIMHRLDDLSGGVYGGVLGCYEADGT